MTTNVLKKIFPVLFATFIFSNHIFAQTNSVSSALDCPSHNNNGGGLYIDFAKSVNLTSLETDFKLKIICPDPMLTHDNLAIDSVKLRIEVNTTDDMPIINLDLDESITNFFKVVNIELNNAIDIEVAIIDEGFVKNVPSTFTTSPLFGNVVKLFIDVYENNVEYAQEDLELTH